MSELDRNKWNARYDDGAYADRDHPSALLSEWIDRLEVGSALDIACGTGRNARFLARRGFTVDAIDIAAAGLERGRKLAARDGLFVNWIERDLDSGIGQSGPYQLILMFRFVNKEILSQLPSLLAPGGILLCEQHMLSNAEVIGPRNAAFRVAPGFLLEQSAGLEILACSEAIHQEPDGRRAALARLVARHR